MDVVDLAAFVAFLVVVGIWRLLAGPIDQRYRRWWAPVLALVYLVVVGAVLWEALGWRPFEGVGRAFAALGGDALWRWLETLPFVVGLRDALLDAGIGRWLIRAGQIVNQSLNLSFLILFIVVRAILGIALFRRAPAGAIGAPSKWFYAANADGVIGLRRHWTFARALFRALAVVAFALALLQVAGVTARLPLGFGTGWPTLSLLLLAELAWYFAGKPLSVAATVPAPTVGQVDRQGHGGHQALVEELRGTWSPWLIAEGVEALPGIPTSAEPVGPCAMLGADDDHHVEGCCLMLNSLLAGRSVLVEDVLPHRIATCIGYFLRYRVTRGDRVLILVEREDQIDFAKAWLVRRFGDTEFTVTGSQEAFTANPTAVVATVQADLLRLLERAVGDRGRRFGDDLGVIVALDAQATVLWHGPEVDALIQAIADVRGAPPQVLAVGEWREGADEAFRNIVGIDAKELQLADTTEVAHYLAWRLESPSTKPGASFFQEVFVGGINAYISPEVTLAYPSIAHAQQDVLVVQQEGLPFHDIQADAENVRRGGQLPRYADRSLEPAVVVVASDWEIEPSTRGVATIIGRDRSFDVVSAVRKWLPVTTETLVQVVSPQYLLRDYFRAVFRDRLRHRRSFSALAPSYAPSPWSRAYALYRRLDRGWVDVAIVADEVRRVRPSVAAPARGSEAEGEPEGLEAGLTQLFAAQLAMATPRFEYRLDQRFVPSHGDHDRFEPCLRIRLLPLMRADRPRWHQNVDVVGRELDAQGRRKRLASYPRGHLHQNLLVGQVHAFGGRLYQIDSHDDGESGESMAASNTSTAEYRSHYRQHRTVALGDEGGLGAAEFSVVQHVRNAAGNDAVRLEVTRFDVPLSVRTHGYYQFEARAGLDLGQSVFVPLEVPTREYRHGKLLRARLLPKGSEENCDALSPTLALLLSEMMPSYFPEAHQYLRVLPASAPAPGTSTAAASAAHGSDTDGSPIEFDLHLQRLVPELDESLQQLVRAPDEPPRDGPGPGITVYVVEDSPFDLGSLAMLVKKLDNILDDLKAYLAWHLGGGKEASDFLRFGFDVVPAALRLEELAAFLAPFQALGPRRVGPAGAGVEPETGTVVDDAALACDFCGRMPGEEVLKRLDDGRHRCLVCEADGVNTLRGLGRHYKEARRFFERRYGRRLRERVRIEFATARQIAEYRGLSFSPHSGLDVRAVGLASRRDGTNTIHIENGAPKANTRMTIIHELTHIWQFENLAPALLADRDFIEGQAVWVSLEYAAHHEDPQLESHRAHFEVRDDEYGSGYRRILAAMAATGVPTALDVAGWPQEGGTGDRTEEVVE
jgi:hypothetical protein